MYYLYYLDKSKIRGIIFIMSFNLDKNWERKSSSISFYFTAILSHHWWCQMCHISCQKSNRKWSNNPSEWQSSGDRVTSVENPAAAISPLGLAIQLFDQTNGCVIAKNIKYLLSNTLQVFQALVDQNPPGNKETRRKACYFFHVYYSRF